MTAIVGILLVLGIPAGLGALVYYSFQKGKIRKANFIATKALYDKALFDLQSDPKSADKNIRALELGRQYYGFLHPDLCDFKDEKPFSFRDSSGVIELKVQSDINARTKKGN